MNVKGSFYVITKNTMSAAFGEERWNSFMAKLAEKDKYFKKMIMSITLIPVEKLILIFDEMCKEFFNNDKMQYSMFGKVGAKYALSPDGPYKSYMLTKDIKQFVESVLPKLWSTYFDGGISYRTVREQRRSSQNHRTSNQTYLLRVPYYGLLSAGPQNFREEICCEKGQKSFIGR